MCTSGYFSWTGNDYFNIIKTGIFKKYPPTYPILVQPIMPNTKSNNSWPNGKKMSKMLKCWENKPQEWFLPDDEAHSMQLMIYMCHLKQRLRIKSYTSFLFYKTVKNTFIQIRYILNKKAMKNTGLDHIFTILIHVSQNDKAFVGI